ncbi:MAG: TlpA family protein disulfide reductase [Anaerolineae bacterium]|nr:TlpA family protein disulfide reductase [Anaerolineae bacterium]
MTTTTTANTNAASATPAQTIKPQPRRIKPLVMALIMIVPVLIILGLGWALIEANRRQITSGPAPDFIVNTYGGGDFSLSAQKGNVVVINFWASWCGPCRSEAADLNAIWDEYKDRGVVMVGVGYLDNESNAIEFLKEFNIEYPTGHDAESRITGMYGVRQVPETFVIDKAGNVAWMIPGPTTAADLRTVLDRLLVAE